MKSVKRITILGVGFMGGSLALAIKNKFPGIFIVGYARSESTYKKLSRLKILDKVEKELANSISDSDLVVIASPIYSIIEYFKKMSPFLKDGAIIIDLGSTKELIEKAAKKYLPHNTHFVGCHPLCGSDKSGAEFSNAKLYEKSTCLITSAKNLKALKTVESLWKGIGSRIVFVNVRLHDRILSSVSHLPHVVSFALTGFVPQGFMKFAAMSIRDLTRISNSPANVWSDILISNKRNIVKDTKKYIKILESFLKLIQSNKKEEITRLISKINKKQKKLTDLR